MKQNLLFLFFLNSIISFSQEKKFQYGVSVFPNFSTGIPAKEGAKAEYYYGPETAVFSYAAGFALDWNFAEKWTLSTGILYNEVGENGKLIPADLHRGFLYPHQHRFKICYIELPLNLNRNFGKNFLVEFGISPMIAIAGSGIINRIGLNANFGFGLRTKIANSNLKLMPYMQIGILNGLQEFYYLNPAMRFLSCGIKVAFVI